MAAPEELKQVLERCQGGEQAERALEKLIVEDGPGIVGGVLRFVWPDEPDPDGGASLPTGQQTNARIPGKPACQILLGLGCLNDSAHYFSDQPGHCADGRCGGSQTQ